VLFLSHERDLIFQKRWIRLPDQAERFLKKCYYIATYSRLAQPVKATACSFKRHWDGILNWFQSRINSGLLEGIDTTVWAMPQKPEEGIVQTNI
jgi:transposase